MATILELGIADLAGTRFAVSPLSETLRAVLLLGRRDTPSVNRPWADWARARLAEKPLRMPRLWPLANNGLDVHPEFLTPAPAGQRPAIEDELARMRATPDDAVRGSLRRVFGTGPWPDSATALYQDPAGSLAQIAAESSEFYQRLIAPHWERIGSVLDADIAYRTGLLARGGARALFGDMHPGLRWSDGLLILDGGSDVEVPVRLGPNGVVLMPSVFNWPEVSAALATSSQTGLVYPARGAATAWHLLSGALTTRLPALSELIGVTRARMLDALRAPATTSTLARQFAVTPGAVSQHLAVLHRAGLLTRQRSGRFVLYQASDLGLDLLDA
ncbi:MAG TPA: metalloregulator ArsR/SmtB family transcription factor [Streptosporangiaceae bacterium]|jgi:DNA-binding transcriptional ArsR family regulator